MTLESKRPPLWPFIIVDVVFVGLGIFIYMQSHDPLRWWEAGGLILCAAIGAASLILPVLRRNANSHEMEQVQKLADSVEKIQKLEQLADQISQATSQWQTVQESAAKTAQTATGLAQSMSTEAKAFTEFLQKANDAERAHLRLEVDKLRRGESEWLNTVVRLLDQVNALFQAALQSGKPGLVEQIGLFQNACRDIPRRVGLTALTAQAGEPFDPKRHQLINDAPAPEGAALILDVVAPGYSYQGQLVRRTLVHLQNSEPAAQPGEKPLQSPG